MYSSLYRIGRSASSIGLGHLALRRLPLTCPFSLSSSLPAASMHILSRPIPRPSPPVSSSVSVRRLFSYPPVLYTPTHSQSRSFSSDQPRNSHKHLPRVASKGAMERNKRLWASRFAAKSNYAKKGAFIVYQDKMFDYSDLPGSFGSHEVHDLPKGLHPDVFDNLEERVQFKVQTEEGLKRLVRNEIKLERLHRMRKPKRRDLLMMLSEVDFNKGDFARSYERYFGELPTREELEEQINLVLDDDLESAESQFAEALEDQQSASPIDLSAKDKKEDDEEDGSMEMEMDEDSDKPERKESRKARKKKGENGEEEEDSRWESTALGIHPRYDAEFDQQMDQLDEQYERAKERNEIEEDETELDEDEQDVESEHQAAQEAKEGDAVAEADEANDMDAALPSALSDDIHAWQPAIDYSEEFGSEREHISAATSATSEGDGEGEDSEAKFNALKFVQPQLITRRYMNAEGMLIEYQAVEGTYDPIFYERLISSHIREFGQLMNNEEFMNKFKEFLRVSGEAMVAARAAGVDIVQAKEDLFTMPSVEFDHLYPTLAGKWKFSYNVTVAEQHDESMKELEQAKALAEKALNSQLQNSKREKAKKPSDQLDAAQKERNAAIIALIKEIQAQTPELKDQQFDLDKIAKELEEEFRVKPTGKEYEKLAAAKQDWALMEDEEIDEICDDIVERLREGQEPFTEGQEAELDESEENEDGDEVRTDGPEPISDEHEDEFRTGIAQSEDFSAQLSDLERAMTAIDEDLSELLGGSLKQQRSVVKRFNKLSEEDKKKYLSELAQRRLEALEAIKLEEQAGYYHPYAFYHEDPLIQYAVEDRDIRLQNQLDAAYWSQARLDKDERTMDERVANAHRQIALLKRVQEERLAAAREDSALALARAKEEIKAKEDNQLNANLFQEEAKERGPLEPLFDNDEIEILPDPRPSYNRALNIVEANLARLDRNDELPDEPGEEDVEESEENHFEWAMKNQEHEHILDRQREMRERRHKYKDLSPVPDETALAFDQEYFHSDEADFLLMQRLDPLNEHKPAVSQELHWNPYEGEFVQRPHVLSGKTMRALYLLNKYQPTVWTATALSMRYRIPHKRVLGILKLEWLADQHRRFSRKEADDKRMDFEEFPNEEDAKVTEQREAELDAAESATGESLRSILRRRLIEQSYQFLGREAAQLNRDMDAAMKSDKISRPVMLQYFYRARDLSAQLASLIRSDSSVDPIVRRSLSRVFLSFAPRSNLDFISAASLQRWCAVLESIAIQRRALPRSELSALQEDANLALMSSNDYLQYLKEINSTAEEIHSKRLSESESVQRIEQLCKKFDQFLIEEREKAWLAERKEKQIKSKQDAAASPAEIAAAESTALLESLASLDVAFSSRVSLQITALDEMVEFLQELPFGGQPDPTLGVLPEHLDFLDFAGDMQKLINSAKSMAVANDEQPMTPFAQVPAVNEQGDIVLMLQPTRLGQTLSVTRYIEGRISGILSMAAVNYLNEHDRADLVNLLSQIRSTYPTAEQIGLAVHKAAENELANREALLKDAESLKALEALNTRLQSGVKSMKAAKHEIARLESAFHARLASSATIPEAARERLQALQHRILARFQPQLTPGGDSELERITRFMSSGSAATDYYIDVEKFQAQAIAEAKQSDKEAAEADKVSSGSGLLNAPSSAELSAAQAALDSASSVIEHLKNNGRILHMLESVQFLSPLESEQRKKLLELAQKQRESLVAEAEKLGIKPAEYAVGPQRLQTVTEQWVDQQARNKSGASVDDSSASRSSPSAPLSGTVGSVLSEHPEYFEQLNSLVSSYNELVRQANVPDSVKFASVAAVYRLEEELESSPLLLHRLKSASAYKLFKMEPLKADQPMHEVAKFNYELKIDANASDHIDEEKFRKAEEIKLKMEEDEEKNAANGESQTQAKAEAPRAAPAAAAPFDEDASLSSFDERFLLPDPEFDGEYNQIVKKVEDEYFDRFQNLRRAIIAGFKFEDWREAGSPHVKSRIETLMPSAEFYPEYELDREDISVLMKDSEVFPPSLMVNYDPVIPRNSTPSVHFVDATDFGTLQKREKSRKEKFLNQMQKRHLAEARAAAEQQQWDKPEMAAQRANTRLVDERLLPPTRWDYVFVDTSRKRESIYSVVVRDRNGTLRTPTEYELEEVRRDEKDPRAKFIYSEFWKNIEIK